MNFFWGEISDPIVVSVAINKGVFVICLIGRRQKGEGGGEGWADYQQSLLSLIVEVGMISAVCLINQGATRIPLTEQSAA